MEQQQQQRQLWTESVKIESYHMHLRGEESTAGNTREKKKKNRFACASNILLINDSDVCIASIDIENLRVHVTEEKNAHFFNASAVECMLHATHFNYFPLLLSVFRWVRAYDFNIQQTTRLLFRARFHLRRRFHSWMKAMQYQTDGDVSDWVACVEAIIIIITVNSCWNFVSDLLFSVWYSTHLEHCFEANFFGIWRACASNQTNTNSLCVIAPFNFSFYSTKAFYFQKHFVFNARSEINLFVALVNIHARFQNQSFEFIFGTHVDFCLH